MKCPHCSQTIKGIKGEITGTHVGRVSVTVFDSVAYVCPKCDAILSVQIDPTVLKEEIIERITRGKG